MFLNRTLTWTDDGVTYEPDQRHAELIVKEFDLCSSSNIGDDTHGRKNANPVKTPAVPENHVMQETSRYRAFAARFNYQSLDRPDSQFAAKKASRCMATPRVVDWTILKRAARYLLGAPRAVRTFRWQTAPTTVTTHTDSDWAGERASRKSTSGRLLGAPHDKVLELNTADCCTLKW